MSVCVCGCVHAGQVLFCSAVLKGKPAIRICLSEIVIQYVACIWSLTIVSGTLSKESHNITKKGIVMLN